MPVEAGRTTKRKRITVPGGGTVDVPVITSISFVDPTDRYQETRFTIDNSAQGDRLVTVEDVKGLQVERIQRFKVTDAADRHQETWLSIDNQTRGSKPPPYFITHLRTHVVRYRGSGNDYIDSELIDEFTVLDPTERHQETRYVLRQPQNDDDAQADPSDPEISDSGNGIDPPWRTDPFQNLVDLSQGQYLEYYIDFDYGWTNPHPMVNYIPPSSHESTPEEDLACLEHFIACGGAITGKQNGGQDFLYLRVKPKRLTPGWTSTGLPSQSDIAFGLPTITIEGLIAARANRSAITPPLPDAGDAAKYPNYSPIFSFNFEEWVPVGDSGFYCQSGSGPEIPTGTPLNREQAFGPTSFNLTGATITDANPTSPTTYEIIGTQNTLEYSPYRESPLPWNMLTSMRAPSRYPTGGGSIPALYTEAAQYYFIGIIPFGECRVENLYMFLSDLNYPNPHNPTDPYSGTPFSNDVPGIRWIAWWRVYCLFKVQEETA